MTKPGLSDSIILISPNMPCLISDHAKFSSLQPDTVKHPYYCAQDSVGQEFGQGLGRTVCFCFTILGIWVFNWKDPKLGVTQWLGVTQK